MCVCAFVGPKASVLHVSMRIHKDNSSPRASGRQGRDSFEVRDCRSDQECSLMHGVAMGSLCVPGKIIRRPLLEAKASSWFTNEIPFVFILWTHASYSFDDDTTFSKRYSNVSEVHLPSRRTCSPFKGCSCAVCPSVVFDGILFLLEPFLAGFVLTW